MKDIQFKTILDLVKTFPDEQDRIDTETVKSIVL